MKKTKNSRKITISFLIAIIVVYLVIPVPDFNEPTSTVIYSNENRLLGAKIAADEQWRFPMLDSVPNKYEMAIISFEDQYFKYHPGFNPVSIIRALMQNIKASKVVSGGSTITMQIARLSRKGKARSIKEKLIELVLATKLELKYSKNELLAMYASYAPYGGNVVGLEAAAWRYYGRPPENLTWAESATLAVLPNSPTLIYPGKNQEKLLKKRNRLLKKLLRKEYIDSLTYSLSIKELLPSKPQKLPRKAPHLLDKVIKDNKSGKIVTTINYHWQNDASLLLNQHVKRLRANEIYNATLIVIDNATKNILVYVGNANTGAEHGNQVDIIQAPRSTGSILKPLLYAAMIHEGELLPNTLVPDIPLFMDGFSPKNYSLQFDGAVSATKALSRSLNVPAVHMLSSYGLNRFHDLLVDLDFSTITKSPEHYGLSLILGGAETTLWDLSSVYSGLASTLTNTVQNSYKYSNKDFDNIRYTTQNQNETTFSDHSLYFSAASIWSTFQALQEVNRPDNETGWKSFASANKVAWKTGTSFGFRDAWAVGVSPQYTVGVWVGNADGEGRPGLTGVTAAAPLMFDVFDMLNPTGWFEEPFDEFVEAKVCSASGYLASINCDKVDTISISVNGLRSKPCPYHKIIHLDETETYRVNSSCANPEDMVMKPWFVLPPAMEFYYKPRNPFYLSLPGFKRGCLSVDEDVSMEFVYPKESTKIYVPYDLDGQKGKVVFEVAHRIDSIKLFWHLDNEYMGSTQYYHELGLQPSLGHHSITIVDENGNSIAKKFEIVSK